MAHLSRIDRGVLIAPEDLVPNPDLPRPFLLWSAAHGGIDVTQRPGLSGFGPVGLGAVQGTAFGAGRLFNGSSSRVDWESPSSTEFAELVGTLVAFGWVGGGSGTERTGVGLGTTFSSVPLFRLMVSIENKWMFQIRDAGSSVTNVVGTTTPITGRVYGAVATVGGRGGAMRLFVDGVQEASGTAPAGSYGSHNRYGVGVLTRGAVEQLWNGGIVAAAMYQTEFSAALAAEVSLSPRILFSHRRRRLFVVSSGTSPVTTDLSATYAVQSIATSDSAATYAIRAAISADLGASFAIRTAAQADAAASFVVRGSASADAAASFAIRGAVSADSSSAYAVRTSAAADLAAAFVVGAASVTLDLPAGYAIRTSATADGTGSYAIRTTSTSDASASYSIRTTASADASAAYTVRASAQADAASTFAIRTSASADLAGAFAIINAGVVVADFSSSYNVRGTAQADSAASFAIRTSAEADRAAAFVVRGAAQSDMVGAYDIINALAVSSDLVASWKITGTVARDLFAAYAVGEVLAEASPGFTAAPGVGAPLVARFAPPTFRGQ